MPLFNFGVLADRQEADRAMSRDRIAQSKDNERRRQALQSLPNILSRRDLRNVPIDKNDAVLPLPPDIAQQMQQGFEGQRQRDLLGVLGTAAPEAVLEGVLAQQFPQPSNNRQTTAERLMSLGLQPNIEGVRALAEAEGAGSNTGLDGQMQQLQIAQLIQSLTNARNTQNRETEQQRIDKEQAGIASNAALEEGAGLFDSILATGGNSVLRPGVPGQEIFKGLAQLGDAVIPGGVSGGAVADLDSIDKGSNRLTASILGAIESGGGSVTNSRLRLEQGGQVSNDLQPVANMKALSSQLKLLKDQAKVNKFDIQNIDSLDNIIQATEALASGEVSFDKAFSSTEDLQKAIDDGRVKAGDKVVVGRELFEIAP